MEQLSTSLDAVFFQPFLNDWKHPVPDSDLHELGLCRRPQDHPRIFDEALDVREADPQDSIDSHRPDLNEVPNLRDPPVFSDQSDDSGERPRDPRQPLHHFPSWVAELWDLLQDEGATELLEEGPVVYVGSYYLSHETCPRQEQNRPLRLTREYHQWQDLVREVWHDFFDELSDFSLYVVRPEPPLSVTQGTVGVVLVVQHPVVEQTAVLTTAVFDRLEGHRIHEVAHSFHLHTGYDAVLHHADAAEACAELDRQDLGPCTIRAGRHVFPRHRPIRCHDGLGLVVRVPMAMPDDEWERRVLANIAAANADFPQPHFPDDAPDASEAAPEPNEASHDELHLMARSPLVRLNYHNPAGDITPSAYSTDMASSSSSTERDDWIEDEWHLCFVFALGHDAIEVEVPWHDGEELYRRVAQAFHIEYDDIVSVHTILHCPEDILHQHRRCLLLQRQIDRPPATFMRLCLIDVEYKMDHSGPASLIERKIKWMPQRSNRDSTIRLIGYDGHCSVAPDRCWLWHDKTYIPLNAEPLQLDHGHYVRLAVPAHPEQAICDTGEYLIPEEFLEQEDALDSLEQDDTMLTQLALIHWKITEDDIVRNARIETCVHDTDEPQALVRVHGRDAVPRLRTDPLWELWNRPALRTRGLQNEPVMLFESWYLNGLGFPRCSYSRMVALDADVDAWIDRLRQVWQDRVNQNAPLELAIVHPAVPHTRHGGHLIVLQSVHPGECASLLSSSWASFDGALQDRFAQLIPNAVTLSDILHYNDLTVLCDHQDYACRAYVGDRALDDTARVPVYHGLHLAVVIEYTPLQIITNDFFQHEEYAISNAASSHFPGHVPHLDLPDLHVMPVIVQDLHAHWMRDDATRTESTSPADVRTWFVDHRDSNLRACHRPRHVRLTLMYDTWETALRQEWRDYVAEDDWIDYFIVRPSPPRHGHSVLCHVLLVRHRHPAIATSVLSLFDHASTQEGPALQVAVSTLTQIHVEHVLRGLGIYERCLHPHGDLQCAIWYDQQQLHMDVPLDGDNGLGLEVHIQQRPGLAQTSNSSRLESDDLSAHLQQSLFVKGTPVMSALDVPSHAQPESEGFCHRRGLGGDGTFLPPLSDQSSFVQDLHALWDERAFAWEDEPRSTKVMTYFVDHFDLLPRCDHGREVWLWEPYTRWEQDLRQAWHDRILPTASLSYHVVTPSPPLMEPGITAYVLLVQRAQESLATSMVTLFDGTGRLQGRSAVTTLDRLYASYLIQAIGFFDLCYGPGAAHQCDIWHRDRQLRIDQQVQGRHGLSFTAHIRLVVAHRQQGLSLLQRHATIVSATTPSTGDSERLTDSRMAFNCRPLSLDLEQLISDVSMPMQHDLEEVDLAHSSRHHDPSQPPRHSTITSTTTPSIGDSERLTDSRMAFNCRPLSLVLDELIPKTSGAPSLHHEACLSQVAIQLYDPSGQSRFPSPIVVDAPGHPDQIQAELRHWGHDCLVFDCAPQRYHLCIAREEAYTEPDHSLWHYVFCHDDVDDCQGCFVHSDPVQLSEIQLMQLLSKFEYPRAVILDQQIFWHQWTKIIFHHREPQPPPQRARPRVRSPWPERMRHQRTSKVLIDLDQIESLNATDSLYTNFDCADLRQLFGAGDCVLCRDFDILDLPDELRHRLAQYPLAPLQRSSDLDQYDRILLFTDGSSQPFYKHHVPEHADELGHPDTWALVIIGEIFSPNANDESTIHVLGWTAQPVRYDPSGTAYTGVTRLGSDMAERSALIGAAIWRLTQNHSVPTVICTDSQTGGGQAFGILGAGIADDSYHLLRSLYQTLELALPHGDLCLHHVTSHTGELFNEIADIAAKQESRRSFHHPRVSLDMQAWRSKFLQLWSAFGSRCGMPDWRDGGMDIQAPQLPDPAASHMQSLSQHKGSQTLFHFNLSLATANVQSLYRGPHGHGGKLHYLQRQMRNHCLNVLAIQEARTDSGMFTANNILRFCSGHDKGNYGIELWIDLDRPFAYCHKGRPVHFRPSQFQVVHATPRHLLVHCDTGMWAFWLSAFHAPHSGYSASSREDWWQEMQNVFEHHLDDGPLFILADANADPGPNDDTCVFSEGYKTTANTLLFRELLHTRHLCLPATGTCHSGSHITWTGLDGSETHTIDHIAVPHDYLTSCTYSQVLSDFDLATVHDDHQVVALQLQWTAANGHCSNGHGIPGTHKPCAYHPSSEIAQRLATYHPLPWQVDIEQQALDLTLHVRSALTAEASHRPSAKKLYIDDRAWQLRKNKLHAQRKLRNLRWMLSRQGLQQVFSAWTNARTPSSVSSTTPGDVYVTSLICTKFKYAVQLLVVKHQLKQHLCKVKQNHITETLKNLGDEAPASEILRHLKKHIGPTNPKKAKIKPLPLVRDSQDQVCRHPQEALQTWIRFFQDMEGGVQMSYQDLRAQWIQDLCAFQQHDLQVDMDQLPTLVDIEIALRRVPRGRSCGPDGIPGEVCHHHPAALAKALYAQMAKLFLHGQEHIGYKGGVLVPAYKNKGATDQCASYRSLLVSNHFGKVLHRTLRQKNATLYEKFLQLQQTGGRRHVPVQMAVHQLRAFARMANEKGHSAAFLYLDLKEAFYRVVREVPIGGVIADATVAHIMAKLHMPESALQDPHRLLQEPTALERAGLSDLDRNCMSHPYWNVLLAEGPRRCVADNHRYQAGGFLCRHHLWICLGLCTAQTADLHAGHWRYHYHRLSAIALCVHDETPERLLSKIGSSVGYLLDLCEYHCMTPNLARGKTELLLAFRGCRSRQHKLQFYGPQAPGTFPVICEKGTKNIQLVQSYKHLGGMAHHTGDQRAEVRQRTAIAHRTMTQFRKQLFQNQAIPFERRKELFQTLVLTKFLYGADSWTFTSQKAWQVFHCAIIGLYRRLARLPSDGHFTDEEILVRVMLPSPEELLRRARLRYYVTLLQADLPDVWSLLSKDVAWCRLLEQDMQWMWTQINHTSTLGAPDAHFEHWLFIAQTYPGYWKRLVRRACEHSVGQRRRLHHVQSFLNKFLRRLQDHVSAPLPDDYADPFPELEDEAYGCMKCQLRCKSKAGEAAHMCKAHHQVSTLRTLFDHTQCPACLKEYHTMQKMKAHLHYSARCREVLQSQNLRCIPAPGAGSRDDMHRTSQHDRFLPPLQGQGPQLPRPRRREALNIHADLHVRLAELITEVVSADDFESRLRQYLGEVPISWTATRRTLSFFMDTLDEEDAAFFGFNLADFTGMLQRLGRIDAWRFLQQPHWPRSTTPTVEQLERRCALLQQAFEDDPLPTPPRAFGKHRIVLHVYSGRRRCGDFQHYLDLLYDTGDMYLLAAGHSGEACSGYARGTTVELLQLFVGNELLSFVLLAFLELVFTSGYAVIEHPADPEQDPDAAAIWRLPVMKVLLALPGVQLLRAEVNVFHISAVVAACGKDSSWQSAWHLLFHWSFGALRLDVVTFNSLVRCCAKADRWDSAVQVLSAMSGCDLPPTDKTRSTAAGAIASASLWQENLSLTILCNENKVASNTLITSCGRCCRWRLAQHVADAMAMAAMQPDLVTITAVLTGYTSGSQWQRALKVSDPKRPPETFDAVVYSSLMMACSEGILWKDSLQLLQEMCLPDLFSYSAVISSCGAADQWQLALAIFQELTQDGGKRNAWQLGHSGSENVRQWKRALLLLHGMQQRQLESNVLTCTSALSACAAAEHWQRTLGLWGSLSCYLATTDREWHFEFVTALRLGPSSCSFKTQDAEGDAVPAPPSGRYWDQATSVGKWDQKPCLTDLDPSHQHGATMLVMAGWLRWPSFKNFRDLINAILIFYALDSKSQRSQHICFASDNMSWKASLWSTFAQVAQVGVAGNGKRIPEVPKPRLSTTSETRRMHEFKQVPELILNSSKVPLEEPEEVISTSQAAQETSRPSAAPQWQWQLNPEIIQPERVQLNPHLLDRFIVIPEYRLLFCYMEKVGCQSFNMLLRNLRAAKMRKSLPKNAPIWWQNTPQKHGFDRAHLERIMMDKTWHKAVFFRDPLERFLSAYRSKCDAAFHPDGFEHCRLHFGSAGKTFKGAVKWTVLNHEEEYAAEFDSHFKPMHQFCGGLYQTLHFYDTVEQLDVDTSREKVEQLMKKIGADPAAIPGFDQLFPPAKKFASSKVNADHQHNTFSQGVVEDFYGPLGADLVKQFIEVYQKDYDLFHLKPPNWVDRLLQGQWLPRSTTPAPSMEKGLPHRDDAPHAPLQAPGRSPDWVKLGTGCCEIRDAGKLWSNSIGSLAECIAVCKHFSSCGVVEYAGKANWCVVWSEVQLCKRLLEPEQCQHGQNGMDVYKYSLQAPKEQPEDHSSLTPQAVTAATLVSSPKSGETEWSAALDQIWSDEQCKSLGFMQTNFSQCKAACRRRPSCTAINVHATSGCVLRACPQPLPTPSKVLPMYRGYYLLDNLKAAVPITAPKAEMANPKSFTETAAFPHDDCFQNNAQYWPLIPEQGRTSENSAYLCQARCVVVTGCMHFNFYENRKCELAPGSASRLSRRHVLSGPARCQLNKEPTTSTAGPELVSAGIDAAEPNKQIHVGIMDGMEVDVNTTGCTGHRPGVDGFICGGTGQNIHWSLRCGRSDFTIWTSFSVKQISSTGLSFILWSDSMPHHIGFDGRQMSLFYEGGAWGDFHDSGMSPLKPNVQYELQLNRQEGEIQVLLNGVQIMTPLVIKSIVDMVSWSPSMNTILVQTLYCSTQAGDSKPEIADRLQHLPRQADVPSV
eukprot:s1980_g11.t1